MRCRLKPSSLFVMFAIAVIFICGLIYWTGSATGVSTRVTTAQFITLQTHAYFMRMPRESGDAFQQRVSEYAAGLMGKFEKVTMQYHVNEAGQEQAIVIGEKRIHK